MKDQPVLKVCRLALFLFLLVVDKATGFVNNFNIARRKPGRGTTNSSPSRILGFRRDVYLFASSNSDDTNAGGGEIELPWTPVGNNNKMSRNQGAAAVDDVDDTSAAENVNLPTTGISVSDEMEEAQKDRFVTEVVPIKGLERNVAQLVTSPTVRGSYEPVRYLVALSPAAVSTETAEAADNSDELSQTTETENTPSSSEDTPPRDFVLVDVPPYSPQLVTRMKSFMGTNSRLAGILITCRDTIHYDQAPGVFGVRKAELILWKRAFPNLAVIAYRLEIPRDCRDSVTQVLDGYGPFALDPQSLLVDDNENAAGPFTFVETGRPLALKEWDHDFAQEILNGQRPPDDVEEEKSSPDEDQDGEDYSPQGIRAREKDKPVLAIYTPGHSFGSTSYIFPEQGLCFAGYTIPVEDTRAEENYGVPATGPALDCRGYITTNRAGITRQMDSARSLVNTYVDRFKVVLPARGDPLFLDGTVAERKEILTDILDQYKKIGEIYEQLGITDTGYDDDESSEE